MCSKASWNSPTVHDNEDLERDITTGWQKIQRRRGLRLKRMHEVFGRLTTNRAAVVARRFFELNTAACVLIEENGRDDWI